MDMRGPGSARTIFVPLKPRPGVVDVANMWPEIHIGMTIEEMREARREHDEKVFGKPERREFRMVRVRGDVAYYEEVPKEPDATDG